MSWTLVWQICILLVLTMLLVVLGHGAIADKRYEIEVRRGK